MRDMEMTLPQTKPATEWVNGRALQKVSRQRKHALAQSVFVSALLTWAKRSGSGRVGTEWEFRIQPPGEIRRPLVPDVAYLSYARIPYEQADKADVPRVAPDVVVEIVSPNDRPADVGEKVRVYLAAGSAVVFLVDTQAREVTAQSVAGKRIYSRDQELTSEALPGFVLRVASLFEEPRPRPTP